MRAVGVYLHTPYPRYVYEYAENTIVMKGCLVSIPLSFPLPAAARSGRRKGKKVINTGSKS